MAEKSPVRLSGFSGYCLGSKGMEKFQENTTIKFPKSTLCNSFVIQ